MSEREKERRPANGSGADGGSNAAPEPGVAETARSGDAASPEGKIAALERELREKTEEAAANFDRYLRAVADSDNFKKRMQRDKADAIRFGNEGMLRDLLPVVDNLEAALEHAGLGGNGKSIVEGVELVLRLLRETLERHGVKEIADPSGTPFDPATQEAAELEANTENAPNTVLRQRLKGYRLHDRLLRPARVVVSAGKNSGEGDGVDGSSA